MTIQNGYVTIEELKMALDNSGQAKWNDYDDTILAMAIEGASRWIDKKLKTQFFQTTEDRYFTARWGDRIWVDDFTAINSIKLDEDGDDTHEVTLASTDWKAWPRNAVSHGRPYRSIRTTLNGDYSFPVGIPDGVLVNADWGFNTGDSETDSPAEVRQACLLLSLRVYKRKDSIFGVAGSPQVGGVQIVQARITEDVDIMTLLGQIPTRTHR